MATSLIHYYVIGFMVCPHVAPVRDGVHISANDTLGLSLLLRHLYSCLKGLSCSVKILQNTSTLLNESSCCGSEFSLFIDGSSSASRLNSGKRWGGVRRFPLKRFIPAETLLTRVCSNLFGQAVQMEGRSTSPSARLSASWNRQTGRAGPDHRVGADCNSYQSQLIMACMFRHFLET